MISKLTKSSLEELLETPSENVSSVDFRLILKGSIIRITTKGKGKNRNKHVHLFELMNPDEVLGSLILDADLSESPQELVRLSKTIDIGWQFIHRKPNDNGRADWVADSVIKIELLHPQVT